MAEHLILELEDPTQRFALAHQRLIKMLGHVTPLDITLEMGVGPTDGRVHLEAGLATDTTEPTITKIESFYTKVADNDYAVDHLRNVLSLTETGVVVVEFEEKEERPEAHPGVKLWPTEEQDLSEAERTICIEDIYAAIDTTYANGNVELQELQQAQLQ
jgi:hypothetical protein